MNNQNLFLYYEGQFWIMNLYIWLVIFWILISFNAEGFHESLQDNIPLEPIYTKESTSPNHKTGLTIEKQT